MMYRTIIIYIVLMFDFKGINGSANLDYKSIYLFLSMYFYLCTYIIHIIKNSARYLPLLEFKSMNIGCFNPGPPILS